MSEDKTRVGRYEIIRKIGEGGFGIVYEARDTVLDRTVAVKQLRAELSQIPEYLELFKREFRLMTNLSHPNINRLFDTFEEDGRYYIVMDYMPNGSLADKLKDGKPLSLAQTVEILKPIAKALDYAHSKNLIHRDVKPSNILFTESGEPMLSDFGLVKNVGSGISSTTTLALGTPDYMAPEQILARELTSAVDVYALGVVAFQMLTGQVPFKGNTPYEVQDGHVHAEPPNVIFLNSVLPDGLVDVFNKVLSKDYKNRYSSGIEFLNHIEMEQNSHIKVFFGEELAKAKKAMESFHFKTATTILESSGGLDKDNRLRELLTENQHREEIWNEYQDLLHSINKNSSKIRNILSENNWIHTDKEEESVYLDSLPKENGPFQKINNTAFVIGFTALFIHTALSGLIYHYYYLHNAFSLMNGVNIFTALMGLACVVVIFLANTLPISNLKRVGFFRGRFFPGLICAVSGWVAIIFWTAIVHNSTFQTSLAFYLMHLLPLVGMFMMKRNPTTGS
ncbi:MAG TPA: serine/threonine-protein kinase [Anaerolineaceae bacterium]|nr:serine/threonine-protein kinase [Anaerolineaceae bacterium]